MPSMQGNKGLKTKGRVHLIWENCNGIPALGLLDGFFFPFWQTFRDLSSWIQHTEAIGYFTNIFSAVLAGLRCYNLFPSNHGGDSVLYRNNGERLLPCLRLSCPPFVSGISQVGIVSHLHFAFSSWMQSCDWGVGQRKMRLVLISVPSFALFPVDMLTFRVKKNWCVMDT